MTREDNKNVFGSMGTEGTRALQEAVKPICPSVGEIYINASTLLLYDTTAPN